MLTFKKIAQSDIDFFIHVCGLDNVHTEGDDRLILAASDQTEDLVFYPEVVVRPSNEGEISRLMAYCHENHIPVTPRGAGTGLSGGALPIYGGVVLDTSRLNKIIRIDTDNFLTITQPGVITQLLQETVIEKGLFYPPDPSSRGSCFIGGNVAENAGGPRAVKYGTTRDFVLSLRAVLPNGKIIHTGAPTLKNVTGYNLTQLLVGSEGTLAIITEITLKLIPYPKYRLLMLASFHSAEESCSCVARIFQAGITPSALEFIERDAIDFTCHVRKDLNFNVPSEMQSQLLIELDGQDLEQLYQESEVLSEVLEKNGAFDILFADDQASQDNLWSLRRAIGAAVKSHSVYKEEDTVVPRYNLPLLLNGVKEIGRKYSFRSVCYGHAGDGNLHVNILKDNLSDDFWNGELKKAIEEIFILCKNLGGTISGEHGIGYVQKEFLPLVFSETEIQLQKSIKNIFDPHCILNPGKIFPDLS